MTATPLLHSILSAATPPARRKGSNQRRPPAWSQDGVERGAACPVKRDRIARSRRELAYLSREAMKGCGARRGATCRAAHRQSNKARRLR